MLCRSIVSLNNSSKRQILNAIAPPPPPDAAERTARHLAMCAELADLAMQLARAAAARALADWADPGQTETTEPPSTPEAAPHPTEAPAGHPTPRRPTAAPRVASPRPADPALLFTRLAGVVRDCITLATRLGAAPAAPSGAPARAQPLPPDPRRPLLAEILTRATATHPDRAALNRGIATRLEEHLEDDPGQTRHPTEILDAICAEFHIEPDWAKLPDTYLNALCEGLEDPAADDEDPRATSPP